MRPRAEKLVLRSGTTREIHHEQVKPWPRHDWAWQPTIIRDTGRSRWVRRGQLMSELDEKGLARIELVDPWTAWKHEALDFTPWLAAHLDVLAEALGVDQMVVEQTEVKVGEYSLDIQASGPFEGPIAIENQLERSDHSHLGQLLAYAAGLDASIVVWITPEIREEHRKTIDWLNEHTDEGVSFFAVEFRLIRIAGSPSAPLFSVVAKPNEWDKQVKQTTSTGSSELNEKRRVFYAKAFEVAAARIPGFKIPKPQAESWNAFRSGPFGFFSLSFVAGGGYRAEAYIDTGSKQVNKQLFDELHDQADTFQSQLDLPLAWERLDGSRASRIALYGEPPDLDDPVSLEQCATWSADRIAELVDLFEETLRERAKELKDAASQAPEQ